MSTSGDGQYTGGNHVHVGGYHVYIGGCSVQQRFQYKWKAFINLLPHMHHDIRPMYWTSPDGLMISPRCTHDIPLIYSTFFDVLNTHYIGCKSGARVPRQQLSCLAQWSENDIAYHPRTKGSLWASVSVLVSEDYPRTGVVFDGEFDFIAMKFRMAVRAWFDLSP